MLGRQKRCARVHEREKSACRWLCVCVETELLLLMLDRWIAKKQHRPYMTISYTHFSSPPFLSLFPPPTLISDLHIIKSVKRIPYFGFSNLLRRLVYITLNVAVCEIRVCSPMDKCIELALVKNTERWVSLPRIQIGNFGDLRNAPTWNTHTHTHRKGMHIKCEPILNNFHHESQTQNCNKPFSCRVLIFEQT